jgi:hypothetical protein
MSQFEDIVGLFRHKMQRNVIRQVSTRKEFIFYSAAQISISMTFMYL